MCGIAGIKGKLENRSIILYKIIDSMVSRGPDSQGDYFDDEIALGHRRLKIIDLTSKGDQPMSNENKDIWIIHNGEIYNFKELRLQLENSGHKFKSQTDTEVILHSYEEWGRECLNKFKGMFAFGIWDKNKKELFLARDRLGIKPLYYYSKSGIFIFASQVRAILATGLLPNRLNPEGLLTYLDCGGLKEPQTILKGVYSLMPAHYLILNEKDLKIVNYWNPLTIGIPTYFKEKETNEKINFLLKESVKLHLISDVPLGIFLSGGVDSCSLLSLVVKIVPKIKSVSLIFREKGLNETYYSRLAAQRYHTEHQEVIIEEDYLLRNLPYAIQAMDEPTFNGINTYFVSKVTKETGLRVAISGLGADEVFAGYPSFRRIDRLIRFYKFWDKSPGLLRKVSENILENTIPTITHKDKIIELFRNASSIRHPYFWMRRLFTEKQKRRLLKMNDFLVNEKIEGLTHLDIINQISYLEMGNYMRDILLRDTDFMSMAHSLEVRVPFLDHKLIEFVLSVPGRFKMAKRLNKPLLINSLDEPLPEAIVKRKKMGFVFPLEIWLRQGMKEEVERVLQEEDVIWDEFLNSNAVLEIWKGFLKGHISWQRPWALYVLKKWIKYYLE